MPSNMPCCSYELLQQALEMSCLSHRSKEFSNGLQWVKKACTSCHHLVCYTSGMEVQSPYLYMTVRVQWLPYLWHCKHQGLGFGTFPAPLNGLNWAGEETSIKLSLWHHHLWCSIKDYLINIIISSMINIYALVYNLLTASDFGTSFA